MITEFPPDIDLQVVVYHLVILAIAYVLALPMGWDQRHHEHDVGFRTFPLVAIASASFVLIGVDVIGPDSPDAFARLLQGLATGVGFLGGGAIVKRGLNIEGLAMAASIWATAALGAAVAIGRYEIAIVIAAITYLTLRFLPQIGEELDEDVDYESREPGGGSGSDDGGAAARADEAGGPHGKR